MPSEARACAHNVLRRVFIQGAYADRAFHACARELSPRDRALARRLSYGAIQRVATLDHVIETLGKRSPSALDPPVLIALRVGLYELLYSDGSPEYAVVDDAVELVKHSSSRHAHGLVNALLRRAARERKELLAGLDDSTPQGAALAHSHPGWLAEMWWTELGPEQARSLMAADNEPAETALRVNTLRASLANVVAALEAERPGTVLPGTVLPGTVLPGTVLPGTVLPGGGPAESVPADAPPPEFIPPAVELLGVDLPEAIVLGQAFDLQGSQLWRQGAILAQSRAAMLVSRVLDPQPGEHVLDLCAAPGGKTTHIAALMAGEGEIVAVERNPARARQLDETVSRMGVENVEVQIADATQPRPRGEHFDRVLVDAPCSGLGTLQGNPDLRWRANPQHIQTLAALQCKILGAAAEAVRAGGTLLYATCTIATAENERQIERFLASRPDFAIEPAGSPAAAARCQPFLVTLPDRDRTAGFFIAKLRRR
jgi:16S rRNA (cytosine967-C5)-methyltransferase